MRNDPGRNSEPGANSAVTLPRIILRDYVPVLVGRYRGLSDVLTDLDEVVCLRKVMGHGDVDIDDEATWEIMGKHVPALHAEVTAFLADTRQQLRGDSQ